MRNNVGLIPLSKQIQLQSTKPFYFADMEWNYKQAIEYLEWKNEKK